MNWKDYCIIDNKDYRDITNDVVSIEYDSAHSRYRVSFANSYTEFNYNLNRLTVLKNPKEIDVDNWLVFIKGRIQPKITLFLDFGMWSRLQFYDDTVKTVRNSEIQFIKNRRSEPKIANVMDYLIDVASYDGNRITKEEEPNFIVNQLRALKIRSDSVLSMILDSETPQPVKDTGYCIAPFSTNESQIKAIQKAMTSRVSVIQGPPGTGKTQTILNIIANLLIRGKTIAVVSGNNEATGNVFEKLEKEGLGSLCARLGNSANIEHFFENQPKMDGLLERAEKAIPTLSDKEFRSLQEKTTKIFSSIREKAELVSKINELKNEKKYNDSSFNHDLRLPKKLTRHFRSRDYLEKAALLETIYSKNIGMGAKRFSIWIHMGFIPPRTFNPSIAIDYLQNKFYSEKISEYQRNIDYIDRLYSPEKNNLNLDLYKKESLARLLAELDLVLSQKNKLEINRRSYKKDPHFLNRYPIVLSTTHSLHFCSPWGSIFDYVIIDESSQVDLASATIALSMAKNAVIVGDSKQLPHIIPNNLIGPLDEIRNRYIVPVFINYRQYSLLESIQVRYGKNLPSTLLNEHYRCDSEIIGFCNKRFYDNKLVIQTTHKKGYGIKIIETPSHTANGRTNARQAEIICRELLPNESNKSDIGIVAPYRNQVSLIKEKIQSDEILTDTVHKFQGKEKSVVILSTTSDRTMVYDDPEHTDFLNNPNLINVAISRAKDKLYVIATKEALNQEGTLLNDLAKYVDYYSQEHDIRMSETTSVFDLMYDDYSPILEEMKRRLLRISEFESENIIATVINDICSQDYSGRLSFKFNYPLRKIIQTTENIDAQDYDFIMNPNTHCDFVIFDNLNKKIKLTVEVDGRQHEKMIQKERDKRKDQILSTAGISFLRIKTSEMNAKEKIKSKLSQSK